MKSFILKKRHRKKEEERRTKQSLDLPQTIEANKKQIHKNEHYILGSVRTQVKQYLIPSRIYV